MGRHTNRAKSGRTSTDAPHKGEQGSAPLIYSSARGVGVDYSVPQRLILVSSAPVPELSAADVSALAYGVQADEQLGQIPSVSLVCRNPSAALKAWAVFETWQRETVRIPV